MSGWITDGVLRDVKPGGEAVVLKVKKGVPASGRLLDAHGDPVRTHLLSAMHIEGDPGPGARTAIHGNEGRFDFAGLAPGKHRILAYVDGKQVVVGELDAPAKDVELRLPEDE